MMAGLRRSPDDVSEQRSEPFMAGLSFARLTQQGLALRFGEGFANGLFALPSSGLARKPGRSRRKCPPPRSCATLSTALAFPARSQRSDCLRLIFYSLTPTSRGARDLLPSTASVPALRIGLGGGEHPCPHLQFLKAA